MSEIKSKFEIAVIEQIKSYREANGFSQDDIAEFLDVSRGFIGQVESFKFPSKYNLDHINILAIKMKCSPRDLIPEHPVHLPKEPKE